MDVEEILAREFRSAADQINVPPLPPRPQTATPARPWVPLLVAAVVALIVAGVTMVALHAQRDDQRQPVQRPKHTQRAVPGKSDFPYRMQAVGEQLLLSTHDAGCRGSDCPIKTWRYDASGWTGPWSLPRGSSGVLWTPEGADGLAYHSAPESDDEPEHPEINRAWVTHDSGLTWEPVALPEKCRQRYGCHAMLSPEAVFLVYRRDLSGPSHLYRSSLAADTWAEISVPAGANELGISGDVLAAADYFDVPSLRESSVVWISTDEGRTWRHPSRLPCARPFLFAGDTHQGFLAWCYDRPKHEVDWVSPDLESWSRVGDLQTTPDHAFSLGNDGSVLIGRTLLTPSGERRLSPVGKSVPSYGVLAGGAIYSLTDTGTFKKAKAALFVSIDQGRSWRRLTPTVTHVW